MSQIVQATFAGGEQSPALSGRVDLARYQTGLATCRNFIVQAYGGVSNRPGTVYVGDVAKHDHKTFLIPFRWGDGQNYVLALGDHTLQIVKDGGLVCDENDIPICIETPWPASDVFDLHWAQSADVVTVVHQDHPPTQIKRYGHADWRVERYIATNGPYEDINTDKSKSLFCSGPVGEIDLTSNFDLFESSDVGRDVYIELQDYGNFKAWQSGARVYINDVVVSNSKIYRAVELSGGSEETRTGGTAPDHEEGDAWDGSGEISGQFKYGAKWRYLYSAIGSGHITAVTNARAAKMQVDRDIAPSNPNLNFDELAVEAVSTSVTNKYEYGGKEYDESITVTCTRHGLISGTRVRIVGVSWNPSATVLKQEGVVQVINSNSFRILGAVAHYWDYYNVDHGDNRYETRRRAVACKSGSGGKVVPVTPQNASSMTYKWALSAWSKRTGYPRAVGYFQQRMIFAGSTQYPQTVWLTKTSSYQDFGTNIPMYDDDGFSYTIAAREVSPITHILAMRSLLLMTGSSEWSFTQTDSPVTPTTILAQPQSFRGSSPLSPITVGNMALVVQNKGSVVRDIGYEWASDSFSGNDLCVMVDHLFAGYKLTDWDFAQEPYSCAWCVRNDGMLLGLTYMREQEVFAWHRHDTEGRFESVCCIDEAGQDRVYVTVCRNVGGVEKRYIEYFSKRDFVDQADAVFVDSSLTYDGRAEDRAVTTLSGLDHLEGKTVAVLADGNVHPRRVVQNGSITLQHPAKLVRVGLPYVSDLETLRFIGPDGSAFGKKTVARSVNVLCRDTRGLHIGTEFDRLTEVKQRSKENYGDPIRMRTGWFEVGVSSSWTRDGHICIRQEDPLPVTVLAMCPDLQVGGS